MAETPTDVLVAGHPDIDGATKDFGSLGELVRDTQVSIDGVIVVTRAPDGSTGAADVPQPRPREAGAGRRGRVAVGLFVPPPLAPVAVGAVAGVVIGEFAGYRVERDVRGHSDT
jgi:uncharacterized membrane protein